MEIMRELTPLNRVFCSADYDRSVEYLSKLLPFNVLEYRSGLAHNGWVIPPRWAVVEAIIVKDGRVIYDGKQSPLSVIALSRGFRGKLELAELRKHLHFDHRYSEAIPFHFRQQYRSWDRDWGLCVPKRLYDSLTPGEYEVIIETDEGPGELKLLEVTHEGTLDEIIVLMAHLDHPGAANDGLSGCAVGVEFFRWLMKRKTRFSYRLFLHQEVIGSEYYLGMMPKTEREKMLEGLFLEMLGSRTQLAFQLSYSEQTNIEYAVSRALEEAGVQHRKGRYGEIVVNGEYVWQAYGIPVASLSRYPYPEYHTDRDNLSLMSQRSLSEALQILKRTVEQIEATPVVFKRFEGAICVSNPKYELYVDPGQAAFGGKADDLTRKMRLLMDLIPTLGRPVSMRDLSERVGLEQNTVAEYLSRWEKKKLLEIK
jgi:aminopeptidase-like protein